MPKIHDFLETFAQHYPQLEGASLSPLQGGLINLTFLASTGFVLQRLHPVFQPQVNLDIAALTPILRQQGVPVPSLLRQQDGSAWLELEAPEPFGGCWRVLERLPGQSFDKVVSEAQVDAASRGLARFHTALLDTPHSFAFSRLGIHDTPAHLHKLQLALERHHAHHLFSSVLDISRHIQSLWQQFGDTALLPQRIGHGDPKLSNFLFDEQHTLTGIIDLDTMGYTTLDAELGDALRSWCSSSHEHADAPRFESSIFSVAVQSYLDQAPWLSQEERSAIPRAPLRIALELSSRFAADALNECYFGWDPAAAPSRGEHNLMRARNQLALALDIERQLPLLQAICAETVATRKAAIPSH
ncbi:MAG: phosphotransferase [Myxococcota bacterium]|nr:phosphotransferase [Myxococcota bacterium]